MTILFHVRLSCCIWNSVYRKGAPMLSDANTFLRHHCVSGIHCILFSFSIFWKEEDGLIGLRVLHNVNRVSDHLSLSVPHLKDYIYAKAEII